MAADAVRRRSAQNSEPADLEDIDEPVAGDDCICFKDDDCRPPQSLERSARKSRARERRGQDSILQFVVGEFA